MFEWFILFFVLFMLYFITKKPKITSEKSVPKAEVKVEQPTLDETTQVTAKKQSPMQKSHKNAQTTEPKVKAEAEQPDATKVTQAAPKKSSPMQKTPEKSQVLASKAVAPPMTMPERVGLTAGSIWHYLAENGSTPVGKLVKELAEEEKIIQRSIGWLAQEDKITLDTVDRIETIALKE